jgi:hypothetical protein
MRIDTDRFITCANCVETEHFGNVTVTVAKRLAKEGGWVTRKGEPLCLDCQTPENDDVDSQTKTQKETKQ